MLKQVQFILIDHRSRNGSEYTASGAINLDDVSSMHQGQSSYDYPSIVEVHMRNGDMHRVKGGVKELLEDTSGKMRQALELVPPLLKEIRGFANDAFGGPSSLTDCLDLALTQAEDALKSATD